MSEIVFSLSETNHLKDNILVVEGRDMMKSAHCTFSGQNASLQLVAANCCCNLALGNEKSCLQLTKATSPYLLSHLDGLNNHLLVDIHITTLRCIESVTYFK